MSRRDTIIIAVLVNAGLLMALFATAMRSNKKEEVVSEIVEAPKPEAASQTLESPIVAAPTENILDQTVGKTSATSDETAAEVSAFGDEIEIAVNTPTVEAPAKVEEAVAAVSTPAESTSKATSEPEIVTVTVKKGDVLEKIARTHSTTVAAILKASNITSTNLKIGQVLKVPKNSKKESAVAKKTSASTPSTDAEYYTVKEGDSPWLIASRNKVKLDDLLRLNDMDEQKARRIRPGDKLRIR